MGLREVSATLWRERHLLELMLFKLDEEQLLLAAGRTRWLARATGEVEMVLEELRQTELERAVEVSRVAVDLGLPAGASLRQLAGAAPEPWQGMLAEHRQGFLALTDEVTALVQTNREHLVLLRTEDAFASVGSRYHQYPPAAMVDLQLQDVAYQAALGTTAKALQPTLVDFLR